MCFLFISSFKLSIAMWTHGGCVLIQQPHTHFFEIVFFLPRIFIYFYIQAKMNGKKLYSILFGQVNSIFGMFQSFMRHRSKICPAKWLSCASLCVDVRIEINLCIQMELNKFTNFIHQLNAVNVIKHQIRYKTCFQTPYAEYSSLFVDIFFFTLSVPNAP